MTKTISIILAVVFFLCGCAGSGTIKEYVIVNGVETLRSVTKFEGRNIRGKTKDGAELETKSIVFPQLPSTIIGR